MIEKTLDVTELPVAETVKDGDQLLLVRTQKNGVKAPMRMKAKKQKKQQIVIGRAIRPRACEIGGVENWYVFGRNERSPCDTIVSLCIDPLYIRDDKDDLVWGYDKVVLNITSLYDGRKFVIEQTLSDFDKATGLNHVSNSDFMFEIDAPLAKVANAFRVDAYDLTARVLTLNLTHKTVRTDDLRGTSAHHYFKDGVRMYHVNKRQIAMHAFFYYSFTEPWAGSFSRVVTPGEEFISPEKKVLVKKEIKWHVSNPQPPMIRSRSAAIGYSTFKNSIICAIAHLIKKRRPGGIYKIWARQGLLGRKSDEYLHCRMKCVGLGEKKDVTKGPRFNEYRVTVREI